MQERIINSVEECLKKDELSKAIEILLNDLGSKNFMIRLTALTLAGRLKRMERTFLKGQITQEEYSVGRTKISRFILLLVRDSRKTKQTFVWLVVTGILSLIGIIILVSSIYYAPPSGIAISLPKINAEKISFSIFVNSKLEAPTRFLFELPDQGTSLMPANYVKLISTSKDSIPLTVIQKSTVTDFNSGTDLLNQLKNIKSNEIEVRQLGEGGYRLEFYSKDPVETSPERLLQSLSVSCFHEENIDIPCKTKVTNWNYLSLWHFKLPIILFVGVSSILFMVFLYPLLKSSLV